MKSLKKKAGRVVARLLPHSRAQTLPTPGIPSVPSVAISNHNNNTIFKHGAGDIVNNNWVINNVSSEGVIRTIRMEIGDRLVLTALHDAQSEDAGCMVGTRESILSTLLLWAKDDPMRIFWLAGLAGTGKTSIAITLCRLLEAEPQIMLGGAFFCSRTVNIDERTDARRIIPTLATSLAERSPEFAIALEEELKTHPHAAFKSISVQIDVLLQRPLAALTSSDHPIIFVVDALDECSDEIEVKKLLQAIANLTCDTEIKFILTSRPEVHLSASPISALEPNSILRLHTVDTEEVVEDIRLYISQTFSLHPLARPWYSEEDIGQLTVLSEGLFIFASTIVSYILKVHSAKDRVFRLRTALSALQESKVALGPLDAVYKFVLTRASDATEIEPEELKETLRVLACILEARMPLSVAALAELLDLPADDLRESLRRLHSLINVPEMDVEPGLQTIHASLGDYLTGRGSGALHIDASLGHDILAHSCLQRMSKDDLCFNVSDSYSSYWPNSANPPDQLALSLVYACLHWAHHIDAASDKSAFDSYIEGIFWPKFLFWLEVLSCLGAVGIASGLLRIASSAVKRNVVSLFLHDANSFVASSREAIERSAPHIYLSALPFSTKESLVYKTFFPRCTGLLTAKTVGIDRHGGHIVATLTGLEHEVDEVTYSPDGCFIAAGYYNDRSHAWNTRTGEVVYTRQSSDMMCFSAHSAPNDQNLASNTRECDVIPRSTSVTHFRDVRLWRFPDGQPTLHISRVFSTLSTQSYAFSKDGLLLALALSDGSVSLCRTETGQQYLVLRGATEPYDVAFSYDSETLAAGCGNGTILLWKTSTGEPVGGPLKGQEWDDSIMSISFSPSGTIIVSGSNSGIVRLWECQTGRNVATLRGHSSRVTSVRFAPDGRSLISASSDKSIRLWTLQPDICDAPSAVFYGHTSIVRFATFSPDGLYIASTSNDLTVRIWDAGSGRAPVLPLPAHGGEVMSVSISSDGSSIVSGSVNRSVRVWDIHTGDLKLSLMLGHEDLVSSISTSSNGRLIASASRDNSIRLWNATTGAAIGEPLRGHSELIKQVSFSPDARRLASASYDTTVRIWDTETGLELDFSPLDFGKSAMSVAFSPDGGLLAIGRGNGRIDVCNADTGQLSCDSFRSNSKAVECVAWSPHGAHLASGGHDYKVHVWNVSTGVRMVSLHGYAGVVRSVAYSTDGLFVICGSSDHTIILWNAATGARISTLHGHGSWVQSVAFTPDGQSIVSGSADGTIRVWDFRAALEIPSECGKDPVAALVLYGLDNEWVRSNDELRLWVPAEYRNYIQLPPCTMIIGERRIFLTAADTLHQGQNWTACWRNDIPAAVDHSS